MNVHAWLKTRTFYRVIYNIMCFWMWLSCLRDVIVAGNRDRYVSVHFHIVIKLFAIISQLAVLSKLWKCAYMSVCW